VRFFPSIRDRRRASALSTALGLCVALVAVVALPGCEKGLRRGQVAPDFILQDLNGNVRKLSNFRGRPVLVNLWATWCPPCLAELPVLNNIQETYGGKGLVVIGVAGDEDTTAVARFLEQHPVNFEVLLDPKGVIGTEYQITGYPETFLIDREGRLVNKFIGPLPAAEQRPREDVVAQVEALIEG